MAGYSLSKTDPDALVSRQSILLRQLFLSMDVRVIGERKRRHFPNGYGRA